VSRLVNAVLGGDADAVLRCNPAVVNAAHATGFTPLRYALMDGVPNRAAVLRALHTLGVDVNLPWPRFRNAFTPVMWAAHDNTLDAGVLRLLVELGGDVNLCAAANLNKMSPLHAAVASRNEDKVAFLLSLPDSPSLRSSRDVRGRTPLELATSMNATALMDVLTVGVVPAEVRAPWRHVRRRRWRAPQLCVLRWACRRIRVAAGPSRLATEPAAAGGDHRQQQVPCGRRRC
jgi:ankyrin repeat protein